jgi:HEAT repeat protein
MALYHFYAWLMNVRRAGSESIRPENRARLQAAALHALTDDDRTVRGNAASLLGEAGDATALAALRKSVKKESYWLTKQQMSDALKSLEGRL